MYVSSFTVGNTTYNAVMASAVDQDKLLGYLTQPLMERAVKLAQEGHDTDESVIVPMLMALPPALKLEVSKVLMGSVVINGTEQKVTTEDFRGRTVEYNTLLAKLLMWNLSDFFTWLASVVKDVKPTTENQVL